MTTRRWFGLLTLAVAPLGMADDGLNLTPGLWELTYTTGVSGFVLPQSATDQMTPEQKARTAAALKKLETAGPRTHTVKNCITAKELKEGTFTAHEDEPGENCRNTIVTQTATKQELSVTCTGAESRNGRVLIEAVDHKHLKGVVDMASPGGKINMQLTGKWLATSCAGADDE